jgi:nitrogen regulatory protein PII 1
MIMVRAFIRPEKKEILLSELSNAGFHAATVVDVVGRGKQKGIKIGNIVYDEIPKVLIMMAIRTEEKEDVVNIILQ